MRQRYRLVLVEDHELFRAGLRELLAKDPQLDIVGEAGDGREAIRVIGDVLPDLVVMDISMPGTNGIEAIVAIKRRFPAIRILVLTLHKADEYVHESLRAGADGYMVKQTTFDELRGAIRSVLNGKPYLSPGISEYVIKGYLNRSPVAQPPSNWQRVTTREKQIMKLIAEGHTNKSAASYLCLSIKTIERHRSSVMKKLGVHNAAGLTQAAIEKGLIVDQIFVRPGTPVTRYKMRDGDGEPESSQCVTDDLSDRRVGLSANFSPESLSGQAGNPLAPGATTPLRGFLAPGRKP